MENKKNAQVITAETEQGRQAIEEVMRRSYVAEIDSVPAQWARALVVDDVPLSFILVDPNRWMEFPGADMRYAFICDVATRKDRRREGHFRRIMAHTFESLAVAGIPLVVTHGRYQLYRRFGFDVFTHHCGIFTTPEQVESALGGEAAEGADRLVTVRDRYILEDLLLVADVKATTLAECKAALQITAELARKHGKTRILFEHPAALSYGSRYPIHLSLETPFTVLTRAIGARVCVQGAAPEGGSIPDADWVKVLNTAAFLGQALHGMSEKNQALPEAAVCFDTDAGTATIESTGERVIVSAETKPGPVQVKWPSSVLAQLVTGYQPVDVLAVIHDTLLPSEAGALLGTLFPKRWRLSRNESWTYVP